MSSKLLDIFIAYGHVVLKEDLRCVHLVIKKGGSIDCNGFKLEFRTYCIE